MALPATVDTADKDMTLSQVFELGKVLHASGYFNDIKSAAQAVVKILRGRELGIGPVTSLEQIHVVQGKTALSAGLIGALIKRSGRYDYKVVEHTDSACEIHFYASGQLIGKSRFTLDDARKAGLADRDMWKRYPRNLLFARALSNGAKWYCPDVFGGAVYTPEELSGSGLPEEATPIEVEPVPEPQQEAPAVEEPVAAKLPESTPAAPEKPNGRAVGAQRALFGEVERWARQFGFDPDDAKAKVREMMRQDFGVESCSKLTPEQWTEAAKNRGKYVKRLQDEYVAEAQQQAS